ncbi:hypothetical protein [Candidatus Poriferisodalis sp.]|uniref:hypothetical protein n=1 Tax=Candidatus Poriferisodalis sp. TaxID=3101277 RepID=UPI003B01494A
MHSDAKHGAAYGHGGRLGYHPLVVARDDTGEIVHSRMRKDSSQRGHVDFAAGKPKRTARLVVRRTRLAGGQAELRPNWRHHAVVTDIPAEGLDTKAADTAYRAHARVEQAVRDIKAGGLAHCPSGRFAANAARLAFAAPAHNNAENPHNPPTPHPTSGSGLSGRADASPAETICTLPRWPNDPPLTRWRPA